MAEKPVKPRNDDEETRASLRQSRVPSPEPRNPNPESRGSLKRRDVLKAITAVPAALVPLASAAQQQPHPAAKAAGASTAPAIPQSGTKSAAHAYQPKALNPHEWKTLHALSDLIIPADERSGSATQAGVPEFIDDTLDLRKGNLLAEIRGGLVWLDIECGRQFSRDFIGCSAEQQKQILDRVAYPKKAAPEDANGVAFFSQLRNLVVSGFFSSAIGIKDLPYLGNQMVAEWDGCPPEVLAKLGLESSKG